MTHQEYTEALRRGQKEFRADVAAGRYPYLQVLDDLLENGTVERQEDLGQVEIPMELIAGTRTAGRKTAFSRSFLPLLGEDTEFAAKWRALCAAHMSEEGIRDPVEAWEYLGRFYIGEGNKRVSVLRWFGAAKVPARVTRLVPPRRDTRERRIYYEYMDFYKVTGLNELYFSAEGRFARLCAAAGKQPDEPWSEEERRDLQSLYYYFSRAFRALGGGELPITPADALLVYLSYHPYAEALGHTEAKLRENLTRIWEEVRVLAEPKAVEIRTEPEPGSEAAARPRILPALLTGWPRSRELSAAFFYEKDPAVSPWTASHEFGRSQAQEALAGRVTTRAEFGITDGNAMAVMERAVECGCEVLFTTSAKLLPASLKIAAAYPEVKVLNCSMDMAHPSIRTYHGRLYEAKFLLGAIAGALAGEDRIGYVADYPILGVPAGINAFALGARMTNPRAEVQLEWTCLPGPAPAERFAAAGIDLICHRDLRPAGGPSREFGLFRREVDGSITDLAAAFWNWGAFYEAVLRMILNGRWADSADPRAVNYWWGMSSGVVEMLYSRSLPAGVRRLADLLQQAIARRELEPFAGAAATAAGVTSHSEEQLRPEFIQHMNWLAENVRGHIPALEELTEESRALVELQGLDGLRASR